MARLGRRRFLGTASVGTAGLFLPARRATAQDSRYPPASEVTPDDPRVHYIEPDPDARFHHPYLLYAPGGTEPGRPTATDKQPADGEQPLVVEQNARTTSDVDAVIESALNGIQYGTARAIADELHSPVLYSLLPVETDDPSFQNLNRTALRTTDPPHGRPDRQLLAMIDDARRRLAAEPYTVAPKVHLNGFSSSGVFADQFTALYPNRVNAVSTGGNGVSVVPATELDAGTPTVGEPEQDRLPWQVGVADLDRLVGAPFDRDAWLEVAQYRYIGGEDQWDPDVHDHPSEYLRARTYQELSERRRRLLLDIFGWAQVDERFETSRAIHEHFGSPAEFVVYDGVGHTVTDEMTADIVAFHRAEMERTYGPPAWSRPGGPTGVDPLDPDLGPTERLLAIAGVGATVAAFGASYLLRRRGESP